MLKIGDVISVSRIPGISNNGPFLVEVTGDDIAILSKQSIFRAVVLDKGKYHNSSFNFFYTDLIKVIKPELDIE